MAKKSARVIGGKVFAGTRDPIFGTLITRKPVDTEAKRKAQVIRRRRRTAGT